MRHRISPSIYDYREESKLLTVIIPIKDRPFYTKRMLDFYNKFKFPFCLIIADGSADDKVKDIIKNGKYKNLNMMYLRFPFDETYDHFIKKVLSSIELVKTKYVILGDDDNFFSPDGLASSVRFLEENHGWSSCQGATVGFRVESSGLRKNKRIRFSVPLMQYSLQDSSAHNRLAQCLEKNFSTLYAVQKKQDIEKSFKRMVSAKVEDLFFFEAFLHMQLIINGRHKSIDTPYMFRQFDVINSSNDMLAESYGDNFDRLFLESFFSQYDYFCTLIANSISLSDKISIDDANIIAHSSMKKLFAPVILHCLQQRESKTVLSCFQLSLLLHKILKIPSWIFWLLKRKYGPYRNEVIKIRKFLIMNSSL